MTGPPLAVALGLVVAAACSGTIDPADARDGAPPGPGTGDGGDTGGVATGTCRPPEGGAYLHASDAVFEPSRLVRIDLTMTADDWAYQLANPDLEEYRAVDVEICGERVERAAMRFKKSSKPGADLEDGYPKNPMVIDFNELAPGQRFFGLRKLDLEYGDDGMLVAERANWELVRAFGLPASRVNTAEVYLNGDYLGAFTNVERVDTSYVRYRWGAGDGQLYKHAYCGTFTWLGASASAYTADERCYSPVPEESATDHADLIHVIDVIDNTPADQVAQAFPAVWNMKPWIETAAALQALAYTDSPNANGNNFYTYFPAGGGPVEVALWDLDSGFFGSRPPCETAGDLTRWPLFKIARCHDALPLFQRTMEVPAWRAHYLEAVRAFAAGPFAVDAYRARIEGIEAQIRDAVAADPNRRGDDAGWRQALDELVTRQAARIAFLREELAAEGVDLD